MHWTLVVGELSMHWTLVVGEAVALTDRLDPWREIGVTVGRETCKEVVLDLMAQISRHDVKERSTREACARA